MSKMKKIVVATGVMAGAVTVCKIVKAIKRENHRLREENSNLEECARTDELTGLGNRYALREDFEDYRGKNVIVFLLDVDSFKAFNDTYGHDIGDEVLKAVASELQTFFCNANCYRYGGDEFLVIAETDDPDSVVRHMDNLDIALEYLTIKGVHDSIRISYGYTYGTIDCEDNLRAQIYYADESLYAAKAEKRED